MNKNSLLEKRYFQEGETTWEQLVARVTSHAIDKSKGEQWDSTFDAILNCDFLPSRMPYMGTERPFSSSCFVFGLEDDFNNIMRVLHKAASVSRWGGGWGSYFTPLRPKGELISSTKGEASGPVSFIKLFHDTMTCIKRAGKKHAAQMAILHVDHPDILEFIECKNRENDLSTFNISVGITDEFMRCLERDGVWTLKHNGKVSQTIPAATIWRAICTNAWRNGDPGVIFVDEVDRGNKFSAPVVGTNACSEMPMPDNASCNLASINLSNHISRGEIDFRKLAKTVKLTYEFLDESLLKAWFPLDECADAAMRYRNLGIGVMGWADALVKMGVRYDSKEAVSLAEQLSHFIQSEAEKAAIKKYGYTLNQTLTSIAPTGSISMLAGCSSGIEPIFAEEITKHTYVGSFTHKHPLSSRDAFVVAHDIGWEWHIRHLAAWQSSTDNGVSKTVSMPNDSTVDDASDAFKMAYKLGCKSATIYRDGSRSVQVLNEGKSKVDNLERAMHNPSCVECGSANVKVTHLCTECQDCGYSGCSI